MFRSRITQAPIPFDAEAGRASVSDLAPPSDVADLVAGTAGCSPFLAGLMRRERDWLHGLWDTDPDAALSDLLADVAALDGDPTVGLRRAKRRASLLVGLADLGGIWPVMTATARWTDLADATLARALAWGLARDAKGPVTGDGGLVAIAMGKMGAGELNYSSDIDLVLLFDESRYDPSDYGTARAILLKAARRAMAAMSDITADGYVFRTDLRLRPDPSSTPIVLSMEAAERYYEAMGRTWERVAWIKARAAAGATDAGAGFIDRLAPFVWRRNLDFAVVEEAFDMRRRIRDHKGLTGDWDIPGHDVKLGQGGIREIEFLTQTQQIIAGGRDASLRVRGTLAGLDRLVDAGWVKGGDRDVLAREYEYLRRVEHRIQMVQDAQTHRLPKDAEGLRRIACFMGEADATVFVDDLRARMQAVAAITDPSFRAPEGHLPSGDVIEGADAVTDRWTSYPALRSARGREIFARLKPGLLAALARSARPAEALAAFDGFLRGLPAGVQVFSLFEANPRLVDLLADICATAPDLATYLSRNAGVFDAVIGGGFLEPLPQVWDLPTVRGDFEDHLTVLRRWHREAHFRIGVHLLRGLVGPEGAGVAYAALARAVLTAAWVAAEVETTRRYGRVPGLRLAGLGMGSLGAGRLTARSDLDLVVLHDGAAPGAMSDGRRSLGASQWAAKFTQVLITALSVPTRDGRLYEVDMRLRPSGRQGPVATPLSGFRSYQKTEAWVWEHLALTRARAVVGDPTLRTSVEAVRGEVIASSRFDKAEVLTQLAEMRARLMDAGRAGAGLSVKSGPGRLQDIELAAQAHTLIAGSHARRVADQLTVTGWLDAEGRAVLTQAYDVLASVQQVIKLLTDAEPPGDIGTGGAAFVARTLDLPDLAAVEAACDAAAGRAAQVIDAALDAGGAAR
ncbi:glutamine-synthetase adenylyltransferase [Jannaschia donghaensis]|uniref:Glutamate-ammonia-ligase adenylyltransferase n=1 Tax=Jannaschia donghaensis TaxID=420998 RepID=A0A0M6YN65_9RHOB|nr:glutamine-synthetase adenylyltransferase [Jannaschia donghaensis]CTQ50466.1 Glutamate-ammonia-ligase adenylyltransferase [Jannaschia donghaensis]